MKRFGLARAALLVMSVLACATAAQASNLDRSVVPEPGAMLLLGTGLLVAARRLQNTS